MPGYRDHLTAEHLHSACGVYPTIGAGGAWVAGSSVISGVGAGTVLAWVTVIPAGIIQLPFDIHWINVEELPFNAGYELWLAKGAPGSEIEIARVRFTRVNNNEAVNGFPVIMAIVPANSAISAKLSCSSGNAPATPTLFSMFYHTY